VWLRCAVGIIVVIIAAAFRLQFLEALGSRVPFLTFFPVVAVAALYGGLYAGLPATVLSVALADYFWMEPAGRFGIKTYSDLMSILVFLASGILISYLVEVTCRARKAAADLQKSESKYRELVQNANSAIIRWKRDGAIVFFNEYAQQLFGYGAEEMIGKNISMLIPEEDSAGGDLTGLVQNIVSRPERYANHICEHILRDGRRVRMAWTNRPAFDRDGQLLEMLAVGVDITERKRIEEQLKENESRLDLALRSAHMGVWNLDVVENRRFFDDQVCHLLGIDPAKFTGAAEEFYNTVHPDDRDMVEAALARTIERDVPYETEFRALRPDGSVHHVSVRGKLVRDVTGRPLRVNGIIWDVTQRKRAEMTLSQSQSRFKLLSETSSRLLASEDPQTIVEELCWQVMQHLDCHAFLNFLFDEAEGRFQLNAYAGIPEEAAREIGSLEVLKGREAGNGERVAAEDIPNVPDACAELLKSHGIQSYACHPLLVRGKTIGALAFGSKTKARFSTEDLALMKTVADQVATSMEKLRLVEELRNSRDGLELRVRERTAELDSYMARLQQSNQALQDFAYIAAHDMGEPLRKVISFGKMLVYKCGDSLGQAGNDYLNRMLKATERMQSLLTSLLEYSRITTRPEPFTEINLNDIIQEVLSDLEVRLVKTGGEVHVEDLPVISADHTQMGQLFQNLIGNALKFHKPGEQPIVRVRAIPGTGSECRIVVEDNGIGFGEQDSEKIFAPFQRLHGRSEYEGTGMGLAICKKIVERHGGSIVAGSVLGKGSTFTITLPRSAPAV
jgi:PAS domain S-box-containing protein